MVYVCVSVCMMTLRNLAEQSLIQRSPDWYQITSCDLAKLKWYLESCRRCDFDFKNPFVLRFFFQIVQAIYFTVSIVNDVIGTNEVAPRKPPTIRRIKDYLMATFAFPLALNVGITFWALMTIDRELVMPKSFDVFFPRWVRTTSFRDIHWTASNRRKR